MDKAKATTLMTNDETVALPVRDDLFKLVDAMVIETRRFARNLAIWLAVPGIGTAIFVLAARSNDLDDRSTRIGMACVVLVFAGLLPALAARWLVMRDIQPLRALLRDGDIHPARIARRDLRSFRGGASHLVVAWDGLDREHRAHFDVRRLEDRIAPGTAVVVKGKRGPVGVVINSKLFMARRSK